jgi:4-diphosphocytidyl-2-C-methyl-D-erythritol kinase
LIVFPNAKINIGLRILEKRSDGFHNIETCFYPVGWQDAVEIIEAKETVFTSSGIDIPGGPDENICLKAYQLFRKDFNLPNVHIHLHKAIPIGAGLGGGSADGAFTLSLLNDKFNLILDEDLLIFYAEQLGSDCAFFIRNSPSLGLDKGERLEHIDLDLSGLYIVIVYPGIHISTVEAYAGVKPARPNKRLKEELERSSVSDWKNAVVNDFEAGIFQKYPLLDSIKKSMYKSGALYSAMTGSGSAIFGLFEKKVQLDFSDKFLSWSGYL